MENKIEVNRYIDHTKLSATATSEEIENLVMDGIKYNFYSVCISSCWVKLAKGLIKTKGKDANWIVCSVIGFPLGNQSTESKKYEAMDACKNGADEIDMVVNIGDPINTNFFLKFYMIS